MKIQLKPFFINFMDRIMEIGELDTFRLQAKNLVIEKKQKGFFEKLIKMPKRILVINYYMSFILDTLFVLTAHIVRAGEPREKEKSDLNAYLEEIQKLEDLHEN